MLTCMLQLEPSHRLSMAEIMGHEWMQGETPTADEISATFQQREKLVIEAMDAERQQKE